MLSIQDLNFDTSSASLLASSCTSCAVLEDKSAYWVPALYFTADNVTFTAVPRMGGLVV